MRTLVFQKTEYWVQWQETRIRQISAEHKHSFPIIRASFHWFKSKVAQVHTGSIRLNVSSSYLKNVHLRRRGVHAM